MISRSVFATKKLAQKLAGALPARVFALVGELGSGKTTFVQAFLRALGIKQRITSPTFLIIRNYKLKTKNHKLVYHIDCYRLKNPKELLQLGLNEILSEKGMIVLIEWADKIKTLLPPETKWIYFEHGSKDNERIIKASS